MRNSQTFSIFREVRYYLWVVLGAGALTIAFFIILPLMQTISKPPPWDLIVTGVDLGQTEPPPPSPQAEQQEPEPESEDKPPELTEADTAPLDLSMLEIALNPGFSSGWMGSGDFAVKLDTIMSTSNDENVNEIVSFADLDQKPRIINQTSPILSQKLRQKTPASVTIIFIVDEKGHVMEPHVKSSSDSAFEKPALDAVKRWVFEPGKKSGKAVRFRMLVPISFPKG
jgi:protein TonB